MSEIIEFSLEEEEKIIERGFSTFIEVGLALVRIRNQKKYLKRGHSTFEDYMEKRWGWSRIHGYRQICGAQIGQYLSDVTDRLHPTHETQVRHLSKLRLPDDSFDYEKISEAWEDACRLAKESDHKIPTEKDVKYVVDEMLWDPPPPLPEGVYNVIYADPPWDYGQTMPLSWGPARLHYQMMTLEEICEMELPKIDDDAVLFLWVTNPYLRRAFQVVDAWGFEYKTNMIWLKTERQRPGSGYYVRGWHEFIFIATRGSFTPLDKNIAPPIGSYFEAPQSEHSEKPEIMYHFIETLYPDCSYIELFARKKRTNWTTWGLEAPKF